VSRRRKMRCSRVGMYLATAVFALLFASCRGRSNSPAASGEDAQVTSLGTVEVTARLVEIPDGAIFKRELYDYATILKYRVVKVHRGKIEGDTLFVGQYNPFEPRDQAADRRVKEVGETSRPSRPVRCIAWRFKRRLRSSSWEHREQVLRPDR